MEQHKRSVCALQAVGQLQPHSWALKVADKSQLVFAVEVIAASQAQALAQERSYWHGRVFLPMLRAVGRGKVVDEPNQEGTPSSMLLMELAHTSLERHEGFLGDGLVMVAWGLASTLALLNAAGFIHGDLKPSNILWYQHDNCKAGCGAQHPHGWPLLTDFGSAQSFHRVLPENGPVRSNEHIETHGWTPSFAAPEVEECKGKWQTVRSDMFSYAKTIMKISQDWKLPGVLEKICKACLQGDPKKRPESFTAIASALEGSCPKCLSWGRELWDEQQKGFSSPALAHQHTSALKVQGLQTLLAQRKDGMWRLKEGSKAKQVIEPYLLLARQHLMLGSPSETVGLNQEVLMLNPCWAVSPESLSNLGNAVGFIGDAVRSKELLERAVKIGEACDGHFHPEVAKNLVNLGIAEGVLGNADRQKELVERALKILERLFGQDHPEVAKALTNLGNAEGALDNAARQKELQERALKILENFHGEDHPEVAITLCNLGSAEGSLGNAARKKELVERALKIQEGFFGHDHPEVARTLTKLGSTEGDLGNVATQNELLERSIDIVVSFLGQDNPEVRTTLTDLKIERGALRCLELEGVVRPKELEGTFKKEFLESALKLLEHFYGQSHYVVGIALCNLGNAEGGLGNAARQAELQERALQLLERSYGQDHYVVAITLCNLGNAEGYLGHIDKKKELLDRALKVFECVYGQDHIKVAKTLCSLGNAEGCLGNAARKKELLQRALNIFQHCARTSMRWQRL